MGSGGGEFFFLLLARRLFARQRKRAQRTEQWVMDREFSYCLFQILFINLFLLSYIERGSFDTNIQERERENNYLKNGNCWLFSFLFLCKETEVLVPELKWSVCCSTQSYGNRCRFCNSVKLYMNFQILSSVT